jgi:hypothetical protein
MKRIPRILSWLTKNALLATALYLWVARENRMAWNIFRFITAFLFVFYGLIFCASLSQDAKIKASIKQHKPPVMPMWVNIAFDLSVIVVLAAMGNFGWASLWVASMFFYQSFFARRKELNA